VQDALSFYGVVKQHTDAKAQHPVYLVALFAREFVQFL
jgi:hypothetical protein